MKRVILFLSLLFFFLFPIKTFAQEATDINKRITVDIGSQQLTAWENEQIVYQTPVSTGLSQSPTPRGTYTIGRKYVSQDMRGISPVNGRYYHPSVPYVMYFSGAYAIHGTNWHSNFGVPMSNGCVNVSVDAGSWIYNWAPSGTRVEIF